MKTHELKTWPEPFTAIIEGRKVHEVRAFDRPFAVGDVLLLQEWNPDPTTDEAPHGYTGRFVTADVTYLTPGGSWGLPSNLCVMSIVAGDPHS